MGFREAEENLRRKSDNLRKQAADLEDVPLTVKGVEGYGLFAKRRVRALILQADIADMMAMAIADIAKDEKGLTDGQT